MVCLLSFVERESRVASGTSYLSDERAERAAAALRFPCLVSQMLLLLKTAMLFPVSPKQEEGEAELRRVQAQCIQSIKCVDERQSG